MAQRADDNGVNRRGDDDDDDEAKCAAVAGAMLYRKEVSGQLTQAQEYSAGSGPCQVSCTRTRVPLIATVMGHGKKKDVGKLWPLGDVLLCFVVQYSLVQYICIYICWYIYLHTNVRVFFCNCS